MFLAGLQDPFHQGHPVRGAPLNDVVMSQLEKIPQAVDGNARVQREHCHVFAGVALLDVGESSQGELVEQADDASPDRLLEILVAAEAQFLPEAVPVRPMVVRQ